LTAREEAATTLSETDTGSNLTQLAPIQPTFSDLETTLAQTKRETAKISSASFAKFSDQATLYTPSLPDYQINPTTLENINYFANVTPAERSQLDVQDFFVRSQAPFNYDQEPEAPTQRTDDWVDSYLVLKGNIHPCFRQPDDSIFISTDFLAHLYHRLLQRQMEYLDKEEFAPRLKTMTWEMLALAKKQAADANSENKASWQRVQAYLAVGGALLDSVPLYVNKNRSLSFTSVADTDTYPQAIQALTEFQLEQSVIALAQAELEKIYDAASFAPNSIFANVDEVPSSLQNFDYTQFTPRSYYNKNAILRSYFRAMIWYGRTGFDLVNADLTRDALNLTKLLNDQEIAKLWQDIYNPTNFLVGASDDLSFQEYLPFTSRGQVSQAEIQKIQANASNFPAPQILSAVIVDDNIGSKTEDEVLKETLGWRLMGQRFTPDAMIFDRLTAGETIADSATGEKLPSGVTAPMVIAALGSSSAEDYLQSWATQNWPNSRKILTNTLAQLRQEFSQKTLADWTQNVYWAWFYLYQSLINDERNWQGYPRFMAKAPWRQKDLNTIIGSWTELKHATLLYAKQSYAELGGGGDSNCEELPVPKGYVEPNIEFYDRLENLMIMVNEGLTAQGVLNKEIADRSDKLLEAISFYRTLAVKELANDLISDDDFASLQASIFDLTGIAGVLASEQQTEREARSALIADVHTDATQEEVYYEATGLPQHIFVAVHDANGARLTQGLIYSHYEFTQPLVQERLNDEIWQEHVYSAQTEPLATPAPWSKF
jgi:hypothetical protein